VTLELEFTAAGDIRVLRLCADLVTDWMKRLNGPHAAFVSNPRSRTAGPLTLAPPFTSRSSCPRDTYANSSAPYCSLPCYFCGLPSVDGPRADRRSDGSDG
jgi:hypothetical protein